jgi:phospholipid/cholesterol/gamma-HCH transport system permease protein
LSYLFQAFGTVTFRFFQQLLNHSFGGVIVMLQRVFCRTRYSVGIAANTAVVTASFFVILVDLIAVQITDLFH